MLYQKDVKLLKSKWKVHIRYTTISYTMIYEFRERVLPLLQLTAVLPMMNVAQMPMMMMMYAILMSTHKLHIYLAAMIYVCQLCFQ